MLLEEGSLVTYRFFRKPQQYMKTKLDNQSAVCSSGGSWLDAGVRPFFNRINVTFGKVHFSGEIDERL